MPALSKATWFFFLSIISLCCAIGSFWYFTSFPTLVKHGKGSPIAVLALSTLGIFTLSALCLYITAFIRPCAKTITLGLIHASAYSVFLLIMILAGGSPGHSSPGSQFEGLITGILFGILIFELIVIAALNASSRFHGLRPANKFRVFFIVFLVLFGGWSLGVCVWSLTIPSKAIAAAEAIANGRPYCIEAASKSVSSLAGLNGINMYAHDHNGWTLYFHGLMVIGDGTDRQYMYWSYRSEKFHAVSDGLRKGMNLDGSERCSPSHNFGRNLPLL